MTTNVNDDGAKICFSHDINHICDAACQHFQQKCSLWCFFHIIYILDFKNLTVQGWSSGLRVIAAVTLKSSDQSQKPRIVWCVNVSVQSLLRAVSYSLPPVCELKCSYRPLMCFKWSKMTDGCSPFIINSLVDIVVERASKKQIAHRVYGFAPSEMQQILLRAQF